MWGFTKWQDSVSLCTSHATLGCLLWSELCINLVNKIEGFFKNLGKRCLILGFLSDQPHDTCAKPSHSFTFWEAPRFSRNINTASMELHFTHQKSRSPFISFYEFASKLFQNSQIFIVFEYLFCILTFFFYA